MSADSASEVSGPVATITGSRSLDAGIARTSSRTIVMSGCARASSVTICGEALAIDGERRAGRHAARLGRAHHERAEPPHLFLQQADGVIELVAAEGVAADELGERSVLWTAVGRTGRISCSVDRHAARRGLPGGFGSGETAADDPDGHQLARLRAGRLPAAAVRLGAGVGLPWPWSSRPAPAPAASTGRRGTRPRARARPPAPPAAPRRRRRRTAPRFEQRPRIFERQRGRIRALRDRRVDLAVGDVRTVAPFEHLERRAAVGHLDRADHALGRLARRSASARRAARARARDRR